MVASNVHIFLSFFVCFIVFIHGLFHFLVPFNVSFIFICFHLFSFMFIYIYFHLFSFILIYCNLFWFFHFLFFSLLKNITNLNHLHVDPRLSSADVILFSEPIPYVYIYNSQNLFHFFRNKLLFVSGKNMFWTRCNIIESYNLSLHICCMCSKWWYSPAGTTRNFIFDAKTRKFELYCGNPLNKCVHTWIYTYNKTAQHNQHTQLDIICVWKLYITYRSCMTFKSGYLYFFIG